MPGQLQRHVELGSDDLQPSARECREQSFLLGTIGITNRVQIDRGRNRNCRKKNATQRVRVGHPRQRLDDVQLWFSKCDAGANVAQKSKIVEQPLLERALDQAQLKPFEHDYDDASNPAVTS